MALPLPQISESAMSDSLNTHVRSEDYVFRMPTPPRIVVPPLAGWNYAQDSAWTLGGLISNPDPAINIDFVNAGECNKLVAAKPATSWTYKNRREPQAILPYLYLGPYVAARDKEFLRREGITMVLGVTPPGATMFTAGPKKAADELGIAKATIEVNQTQELISVFSITSRAINAHLRELHNRMQLNPAGGIPPAKVLVFCQTGCDISAGVVAAYLMENFDNVDHIKACQVCSNRRFSCAFDDNMKQLLRTYKDLLDARRTVAVQAASNSNGGLSSPTTDPFFGTHQIAAPLPVRTNAPPFVLDVTAPERRKRGREVDDGDMDVDQDEMDEDRFIGRVYAPFN